MRRSNHIVTHSEALLRQLQEFASQLTQEQFRAPVHLLNGSTLGQHLRHVIEFYAALQHGYPSGVVNYDKRQRDHALESCPRLAGTQLAGFQGCLDRVDKPLVLEQCYDPSGKEVIRIATSYQRELVFNLEHTVHHMALVRIGATHFGIALPTGFGVAASTQQYRQHVHRNLPADR
ncbi:hypothetical protein [Flaviaesturariibacter amylovorans]|uniref:DinB family protein n=1 Tax=Flaviaesturariibacter amylovorans TaxID=1084520 RepID=A0ABP8H722_9BACT